MQWLMVNLLLTSPWILFQMFLDQSSRMRHFGCSFFFFLFFFLLELLSFPLDHKLLSLSHLSLCFLSFQSVSLMKRHLGFWSSQSYSDFRVFLSADQSSLSLCLSGDVLEEFYLFQMWIYVDYVLKSVIEFKCFGVINLMSTGRSNSSLLAPHKIHVYIIIFIILYIFSF